MHTGEGIPKVFENSTLNDTLVEMSAKGLGVTTVINKNNNVLGVFTDGDLRRVLDSETTMTLTMTQTRTIK